MALSKVLALVAVASSASASPVVSVAGLDAEPLAARMGGSSSMLSCRAAGSSAAGSAAGMPCDPAFAAVPWKKPLAVVGTVAAAISVSVAAPAAAGAEAAAAEGGDVALEDDFVVDDEEDDVEVDDVVELRLGCYCCCCCLRTWGPLQPDACVLGVLPLVLARAALAAGAVLAPWASEKPLG